jgi:hypothetical protein
MGITAQERDRLASRLSEIRPHLDERAWRLLLGAEARAIGRGGMKLVAAAVGASADTVARGARELEAGVEPDGRVRGRGAGRRAVEDADPGLLPALEALVDPGSRGDPGSPLRWTTKSTSRLAGELAAAGHRVTDRTVARLLKRAGSACRATPRRSRAGSIRTGTPNSATSTPRWRRSGARVIRSSRWTPRRRSWSGTTRAAGWSGNRRVTRAGSTCTTSPTPSWARRCRTGCMT